MPNHLDNPPVRVVPARCPGLVSRANHTLGTGPLVRESGPGGGTTHATERRGVRRACELTGAYWGRFWLCRYGGPGEPEDRVALADEVVTALRRWPIGLEDVEAAAYVHMIRGLGHHERYDAAGEPADLDASIGLLAAALPALPPDTPWVAVATFALATGYRDRYGTGREPAM